MDEETTPAVEEQEEEPTDPLADERAKLEAERAEVEAQKAANAKRERELQQGFEEAARRRKQAEAQSEGDDDAPELDDASARAVRREAKKLMEEMGVSQTPDFMWDYVIDSEFKQVSKDTGIDYDDLRATAAQYGLSPREATPAAIREAAEAAAKLHKATTFDAEAERARIREEYVKEMEANGVSVESITPKRDEAPVNLSMMDDDRVDPEAKFEALRKDKRYKDLL